MYTFGQFLDAASSLNLNNFRVWADDKKITASCPFVDNHKNKDEHPSFVIFYDAFRIGRYYCSSCHESGELTNLLRIENVPGKNNKVVFYVRESNERVFTKKEDKYNFRDRSRFLLLRNSKEGLDYLTRVREIPLTTVKAIKGALYDVQSRRVLFPNFDAKTRVLRGFSGRSVEEGVFPKVKDYGYKKELSLFGIQTWTPNKPLFLVEGMMDFFRLYSEASDLINVAALMMSKISDYQAESICGYTGGPLYPLLDNDFAGRQGVFGYYKRAGDKTVHVAMHPSLRDELIEKGYRKVKTGIIDKLYGRLPIKLPWYPDPANSKYEPDGLTRKDVERMLSESELVTWV